MDEPYRLEITNRARSDLLAARRWLTQPGSGLRAQLRLSRINRALIELEFAPLRWTVGPHKGVRERLVDGYTICYSVEVDERLIVVRRVFAPYQDRTSL